MCVKGPLQRNAWPKILLYIIIYIFKNALLLEKIKAPKNNKFFMCMFIRQHLLYGTQC